MQKCLWKIIIAAIFLQIMTVVVVVGVALMSSAKEKAQLQELCDSKVIHPPVIPNNKPKAFVTLISVVGKGKDNSNYAESAIVMLHTLRKLHGNKYGYVAMVTPDVSPLILTRLRILNFTVEIVEKIRPTHALVGPARWIDTYAKLWAWGLEEYSKIVYLDADHIILKPLDHLFNYNQLSAVRLGRAGRFSAAMMVLVPNLITLHALLEAMKFPECHAHTEMDQSFLNWYFSDWNEIPSAPYAGHGRDVPADINLEGVKTIHGKHYESECIKCVEMYHEQLREVNELET